MLIWYGGRSPAIERLSARLIQNLKQVRPHLTVAMLANGASPYLPALEREGTRVFRIEAPSGMAEPGRVLVRAPRHAAALVQALKRIRPDLVLIAMNFALAWPLVLLCRFCGTPVMLLVHDPVPHAGDYAPRWQRLSQRWLIRQMRALVALSAWSATQIESHGKPVLVWPINTFAPAVRQTPQQRQPGTPLRFLFLGRMIAYKGLELLHEACLQLQGREDWSLTLAGDGPLGPWAKTMFSAIPQVDVSPIRNLSEAEVDMMMATHDVIICPYTEATQSAVVSEALYAGRPVIVTAVAGLTEQVVAEHSALVLASADGTVLAEAMQRLLDEQGLLERLTQGAAGQVDRAGINAAWQTNIDALERHLMS
ncbi:MAG: glycosyltransferase [Beijerinckiaceae bacterium]